VACATRGRIREDGLLRPFNDLDIGVAPILNWVKQSSRRSGELLPMDEERRIVRVLLQNHAPDLQPPRTIQDDLPPAISIDL
jgi:hypothetical protein